MRVDGIFWGSILILIGVLSILKATFGINIDIFRIVIAIVFIYIGLSILTGNFGCRRRIWTHNPNDIIFEEREMENPEGAKGDNDYHVIFGRGVIDLSGISLAGGSVKIGIDTVFGASLVKINPEMPVIIRVDSAFASARMPDGNSSTFGHYTYRSKNYKEGENCLQINADVVFGSMDVVEK